MTQQHLKDTVKIQLTSVDLFMSALGYTRKKSSLRYDNHHNSTGVRYVSFNTAVKLHNNEWDYDCSTDKYVSESNESFEIDKLRYYTAFSRKLVNRAKLQANKYGILQVQSHVVEFTSEWLYDLLIGDEDV